MDTASDNLERPLLNESSLPEIRIPVSRIRAIERAFFRMAPGIIAVAVAYGMLSTLSFRPTGVNNRITEYSIALVMLPVCILGLALTVAGFRWLVFSIWPAPMGIVANAKSLSISKGPFGNRQFDTDRLDVRYLFEMSVDSDNEDELFESLRPKAEQMQFKLPRMRHPGVADRIEREIIHLSSLTERELAAALRPFVDLMRRDRVDDDDEEDDDDDET
jgi:hypothetical protein